MPRFVISAVVATICAAAGLAGGPKSPPAARPSRVLPGMDDSGTIRLPNQWSLRPAGRQIEIGDFPVNMALHPGGKWLAVLHAGFGTHEVVIVELGAAGKSAPSQRVNSRVTLKQTFCGLCFSPDGNRLYASGGEFDVVHEFCFEDGYLTKPRAVPVGNGPAGKFIPAGLAVDRTGKWLYAAGAWGHGVCLVPLDAPERRVTVDLGKDSYPYACLPDLEGKRLYVSLWAKATVAVVNLDEQRMSNFYATERHPTEMLLSPDGKTLYVACSNSTKVSVIDAVSGRGLQTISCALYPGAPTGNTPCSMALTPDGQMLFVVNADANNVAVFNVTDRTQARPLGFIPVGMYPTAVRYNAANKQLYVTDGRGISPRANPHGPNPLRKRPRAEEYIAGLYRGTLTSVALPDEKRMLDYSRSAYLCSPLRPDLAVTGTRPAGNPIPGKLGEASPIKHCIYIVRENRTYDQVLGDMKEGNGDAALCLFPEKVTPNAHRLARKYVLLDNFFVEGEVSASGHEWTMGAYCTDFVQKVWPLSYRGSPLKKLAVYPSEGNFDEVERPAGGYLWDRCAEAGVSYRSYGEWIQNGKTAKDPGRATVKALEGHFDPWFRSFDLDYPDVKRAERFIEELHRFEREGKMPSFIVLRLPNDHTYGARKGKATPTAMVAENDLALGMLVEAVSRSKFWKETAIFVLEDDAQNGPDHVDAHRSVALVISPYACRGHVDSTMYSTSSMLRTMELVLGLKPMSQFDAAARPMYNSFCPTPDLRPYEHVVPQVDLNAKTVKATWASRQSEKLDFSKEDAADDLLFNEVIWRAVRGDAMPLPPPVRAAFVFPHLKRD
jgi:YVTN family beta-propeller protein